MILPDRLRPEKGFLSSLRLSTICRHVIIASRIRRIRTRPETEVEPMSSAGKRAVREAVDRLSDEIVALARQIYEHPELAFEERFASELLATRLSEAGFEVERPVAGLETAFEARFVNGEGPTVALLAEYDALPGIGHGCGHHLIAGASLGAALALRARPESFRGELRVMGTPAEEAGSGKVVLVEAGRFADVDAAMMMHPDRVNVVSDGCLAVRELRMAFRGRAAHASSCPERGVNALDACIQTFVSLSALRQHMPPLTRVHGIITHGGERPNVVPEFAEALFFVRAADEPTLARLMDRVCDCARGAATATGATVSFTEGAGCRPLDPDPLLASWWRENLASFGLAVTERDREMGSTDMGDVSQVCRAIHPYLAVVDEGETVDFHTREFTERAGRDRAWRAMLDGAKLLAMTAIDAFERLPRPEPPSR